MTTEYTQNFRLNLPDFRMGPWHDLINTNTVTIDELLMSVLQGVDTRPWTNNTEFKAGMTAIDTTDNTFWVCSVTHTSAPVPTTFAQDRNVSGNPGYHKWTRVVVGVAPRGEWTNSTHYLPNDMVTDSNEGVIGICITEHTSSAVPATIRTDAVYWSFIADIQHTSEAAYVIYDNSVSGAPADNVQEALELTFAHDAANAAAITVLGTDLSALTTRVSNTETVNTTQDTNIANNTNAIVSLDGRLDAVEAAGYITDAVADGKQYARRDHSWSEVVIPTGSATATMSIDPPPSPAPGQMWWETDTGIAYIWYNDGTSSQWVAMLGVVATDPSKVSKAGDTMTGALNVFATGGATIQMNAPTGLPADFYGRKNDQARWIIRMPSEANETGGNAGSNFDLYSFADDGSVLADVLSINRASSRAWFAGDVVSNGGVYAGASGVTGTYHFANSGPILHWDSSAFVLNGKSGVTFNFYISGRPIIYDADTPTVGVTYYGNSGANYIHYDGANFNVVGGYLVNKTAPVGDNSLKLATTEFVKVAAAPLDALAYNGMQINGGMEVSQENGATGVSTINANKHIMDGWRFSVNHTTGTVYGAQIAASGLPGIKNALYIQPTVALASLAAGEYCFAQHIIEGYRTVKLGWGASGAAPLTIGFWVNSSNLSGTGTVTVRNAAGDRIYLASYTINAAATWEYKTITIPGCTDGTWAKDNTAGINLFWVLACATDRQAAPNVWTSSTTSFAATGQTNFVANVSASFSITGVVVLPGTQALSAARSSFIMRPYDQELILCKRYWQKVGDNDGYPMMGGYASATSAISYSSFPFPVSMRAKPTGVKNGTWAATNCGQPYFNGASPDGFTAYVGSISVGGWYVYPSAVGQNFTFDARL